MKPQEEEMKEEPVEDGRHMEGDAEELTFELGGESPVLVTDVAVIEVIVSVIKVPLL